MHDARCVSRAQVSESSNEVAKLKAQLAAKETVLKEQEETINELRCRVARLEAQISCTQ